MEGTLTALFLDVRVDPKWTHVFSKSSLSTTGFDIGLRLWASALGFDRLLVHVTRSALGGLGLGLFGVNASATARVISRR